MSVGSNVEDCNEKYMKRALALARRGVGKTAPNPAVGCVLVRDGDIVGDGWHRKAGTPHAEIHALASAGARACGATVYVTLEPCSHFGQTGPCVDALIRAGVARVFVGMSDPNPLVNGKGVALLRAAGIPIHVGILEQECRALNEPFIKHVITGLPFVILKSAMTLDGKTATACGDSKWITSEKSRKYVHKLRAVVDAVMVGVGTVAADDPLLTCRMGVTGKDPLRIVVDSSLRIPREAKVLRTASAVKTVVATTVHDSELCAAVTDSGAELLVCRAVSGKVDLFDLFEQLGKRGIQSVLLEGGSQLAGAAVRQRLIDKFLLFYAPKILGGDDGFGLCAGSGVASMGDAYRLRDVRITRFDDDFLVTGYPESY
jgi:diaminohydroxyphosphoribosylaminopyrimidine deaminase / 5-amino-6-(5-phosphoribosylamino)uracil reductase